MSDSSPDTSPEELYDTLYDEITRVIVGNEAVVERILYALLTNGHILLEGVPGIAKTLTAESFARASGLRFNRIQMTPDVLPADVTGTTIYREATGEFEVQRGPIFGNIVVADEINRATPKTQSALLEAMGEQQVTIENNTYALPDLFLVIATQNPIEMEGVYELPEAQRDRFQFKLQLSYPDTSDERTILDRFDAEPDLTPASIEQVVTTDEIKSARHAVEDTFVADPVKNYLLDIITATRDNNETEIGASPRATLDLLNAIKAHAAFNGRSYVIPDDVKHLAGDVLAHRLVLNTDAELSERTPTDIIETVLDTVETPSGNIAQTPPQDE
ncbi:AAA family ATPase [Halohasta salina]|uniref:AAA family ATPase n=1 Tax=Halohasta salina TaxID=2961621 RepID=UPI0020A4675B|nr:MoxR family ATPase [Halohasta salina]